MTLELLPLSVSTYTPHELHAADRVWDQTNCWVDAWVEVLHSLGLEPLAAAAFTVATDFEGDQWTFYKYPPHDLWTTYGIDVHEMNPWRAPLDHLSEQLRRGRLMTVEVDAFFLPDTAGLTYRTAHDKTTIVVNAVDREARTLGYWHNAGYHALEGADFDGLFQLGEHAPAYSLAPYCEVVRLEKVVRRSLPDLAHHAFDLLEEHLALRPSDNPVVRMCAQVDEDVELLRSADPEVFHAYAFATLRQCGASAETASLFCGWLGEVHPDLSPEQRTALEEASNAWLSLSSGAKTAQLKLARVARGRTTSLQESWEAMAGDWARAQELLDGVVGRS